MHIFRCRVEGTLIGQRLETVENLKHRNLQGKRGFRGCQALPGSDEKRVAEDLPKLCQRVAYGRLGDFEPLRRTRDGGLLQNHEERAQDLAIQTVKIDFVHIYYE